MCENRDVQKWRINYDDDDNNEKGRENKVSSVTQLKLKKFKKNNHITFHSETRCMEEEAKNHVPKDEFMQEPRRRLRSVVQGSS